jgi:uncharacterized protein (TIGR02588 family)
MAARRPPATSALEWIMAALGALAAIGLLGFIGHDALSGANRGPALLTVRAERAQAGPGGFVVDVEVRNLSDSTAAAVQIEGRLAQGGRVVETSQAVIDYVPGRGRRRAGLLFAHDPRSQRLEVRATGYQEP